MSDTPLTDEALTDERSRATGDSEPDVPVNLHCHPPDDPEVREWRDMNYYAESKYPVIAEILQRAGWRE